MSLKFGIYMLKPMPFNFVNGAYCKPLGAAAFVATITPSSTSRNRSVKGKKPWRAPRLIEKAYEVCPLNRILFPALVYMFLISFLLVFETPLHSRDCHMHCLIKVSNAR